ncbi:unnamed protein product, partial [Iphiclides podalirius]
MEWERMEGSERKGITSLVTRVFVRGRGKSRPMVVLNLCAGLQPLSVVSTEGSGLGKGGAPLTRGDGPLRIGLLTDGRTGRCPFNGPLRPPFLSFLPTPLPFAPQPLTPLRPRAAPIWSP